MNNIRYVTAVAIILSMLAVSACGNKGDAIDPLLLLLGSGGRTTPRFAYVINEGDYTISIYAVDTASGRLRHNGYALGAHPHYHVTVDPSARFAYVANAGSNNISVYVINQATGALTPGTTVAAGIGPYAVVVDPSGRFAYAANAGSNNISVYVINQATGALTPGTAVAAGD